MLSATQLRIRVLHSLGRPYKDHEIALLKQNFPQGAPADKVQEIVRHLELQQSPPEPIPVYQIGAVTGQE
jgi:hypothetical protein